VSAVRSPGGDPARPGRPGVDLRGRVAVVTGAAGGVGRVVVAELVRAGAHVVAVARDASRAGDLLRGAVGARAPGEFEVVAADLSLRDGVLRAAAAIGGRHDRVHLLVNGAGAHFPDRRLSPDGVEMHVAVDHLAAFGLTHLLQANLVRAAGRVVDLASDSLNDTRRIKLARRARPVTLDLAHLDDVTALNPAAGFVAFEAYARAKLLTVTSAYRFAELLRPHAVTVNSVHPGIVDTGIVDALVPALLRPVGGLLRATLLTPAQGAAAVLRLATDPALAGVTGHYHDRASEATTPAVSRDTAVQQRLHAASARWFEA